MDWSKDINRFEDVPGRWYHAGSNMLLDFHGDPSKARLVVFSDGNHHMALKETLEYFQSEAGEPVPYFYITTPPGPIVKLVREGKIQLGSFVLSVLPHVFMGPPHVLDSLVAEGYMPSHRLFVRNRGSVIFVKKGNPKDIHCADDLKKKDAVLFLSSPETERVSYQNYVTTLRNIAGDPDFEKKVRVVFGHCIHHREAPEAVQSGQADAAIVFYHLALHYTRVWPGEFEIVPLRGIADEPDPVPGNVISNTHAGVVGDGGEFGNRFVTYLFSEAVRSIYLSHGLISV